MFFALSPKVYKIQRHTIPHFKANVKNCFDDSWFEIRTKTCLPFFMHCPYTLRLQDIPMGTLCLVQAVQQRYSLIAAACSADMATQKLRRTNCVESIRLKILDLDRLILTGNFKLFFISRQGGKNLIFHIFTYSSFNCINSSLAQR